MPEHPSKDEAERLTAKFHAELDRVGVDMREASPQMHELVPPQETENEDGTTEVVFTIDVSGIVDTLRQLADGAGTDAFVRAYNARLRDLDSPAS
jgi:hypothetical protein